MLAYPSPTTTRFALTVVALLTAGLFVGGWIHNVGPQGDTWTRTVAACETAPASDGPGSAATTDQFRAAVRDCTAAVEQTRAFYALGGGLAATAGGLALVYVLPLVLERRRRLHPPGPDLAPMAARFADLAAEAGVRTPRLLVGTSAARDGFTYGTPGRYRVVLPPAVAVRWAGSGRFDALVRHELAHVRHHDVVVAWASRGLLYALLPLLALPVVYAVVSGDLSLLPSYAWRAVLLATVALVVAAATLRAREHDADLRAATSPAVRQSLLGLVADLPARPTPRRRARALAHHPSPGRRAEVLRDPARVSDVSWVDGFAAAFLAALSVPLLELVLSAALAGTERGDLATAAAGALAGALLGSTLGLGLWRRSLADRVTGSRAGLLPVASGAALGLVLGQASSLARSAGPVLGADNPAVLLVGVVMAMGAVVLLAGLGELWADAAPRLPAARASWLTAALTGALLLSLVLWWSSSLQEVLDAGDARLAAGAVLSIVASWPSTLAALLLAALVATAVGLRSRSPCAGPSWWVRGDEVPRWPAPRGQWADVLLTGVSAGAAGSGTVVVLRLATGGARDPAETMQRVVAAWWTAAGVGALAALGVCILQGRRGRGLSLLAAPVATVVFMAGLLGLNTALGGDLGLDFVAEVVRRPLGIGLALVMAVAALAPAVRAPASARAAGSTTASGRHRLAVAAAVAAVAVLGTAGLFAARADLGPASADVLAGATDVDRQAEATTYSLAVAPGLVDRYLRIHEAVDRAVAEGPDPSSALDRIMAGPVPDLRALLRDARSVHLDSPELADLHAVLVRSMETRIESLRLVEEAVRTGEESSALRAATLRDRSEADLVAWAEAVRRLEDGD